MATGAAAFNWSVVVHDNVRDRRRRGRIGGGDRHGRGGEVLGSWGMSQINLLFAGIKPGDTFRVRFDFGRDGCGGNDGWYVDNVQLLACNLKKSN